MVAVLGLLAATLAAIGANAAPAQAVGFAVTKTQDTADGACDADCSLREAIIAANALSGPDTITVPAGTYNLTITGPGEGLAATGDLDISGSLTITGAGAGVTIVDGSALSDRVFDIFGSPTEFLYTLSDLTITGGSSAGDGGGIWHGGLSNASKLTLTDVVISDNSAANGGGLYNEDNIELHDVTITNNTATDGGGLYSPTAAVGSASVIISGGAFTANNATGHGGGIYHTDSEFSTADFIMTGTTVSGNTADFDTNSSGDGGGIHFLGAATTATITNSTLGPNNAADSGGAIYRNGGRITFTGSTVNGNTANDDAGGIYHAAGVLTMATSTVSGNTASGASTQGGGITVRAGTAALTNVTVSGNTAQGPGGGIYLAVASLTATNTTITANTSTQGGGIRRVSGTATLGGTIVAANAGTTSDPDCSSAAGGVATSGYNLIGDDSGCSYPIPGTGDQVGTGAAPIGPVLGPLGANGSSGPFTHALLAGSPALNHIPPPACAAATDERDISRPQGTNCDVGAYEAELPTEAPDGYSISGNGVLAVPAPGVLGNDDNPEDGSMTASKVTDPASGDLSLAADGSFTYTTDPDFSGTDSFTYRATNIAGSVNTETVTITVTNTAPVAVDDGPFTVEVGATLTINGVLDNDTDENGDALAAVKVTDPANGTLTLKSDGSFTYVHDGSATTSDSFTYKANDGTDDSNVATVAITVTPPPPPTLVEHDVGLVLGDSWTLRDHTTGAVTSIIFGTPTDYPIMGDWDCDGIETPGLFRQQKDPADPTLPEGLAYYRNDNAPGVQIGEFRFVLGNPGDVPLAGDFNGDGCDSLSIYRPSEQQFYIANELPSPIPLSEPLQAFNADRTYIFGVSGDKPFVGDFDGDGTETVGLHRESTGLVYYLNSHPPTGTSPPADVQYVFGDPGDQLVAGDWVIVDGKWTPALFRSSNATFYFRDDNAPGFKVAAASFPFGTPGSASTPVSGVMGLS